MSLRYQQYWSLLSVQKFLRDLMNRETYPRMKGEVRERARICLRHFPFLYESGQPMWSKDEFTKDVETK